MEIENQKCFIEYALPAPVLRYRSYAKAFSLSKSDGGFNIPWCKFGGVRYMPCVMRFEPCCKVRGVANIEVGVRGSVPQDVDIMEVRCWHGGSIVDVVGECK